jgi:hypothetical protein
MLPNVRLLIAAMLASILVLMCGFGVFAAFRVSHEPIAHLPAAMAPLQLVAENGAAPSAMLVARKTVDQHSQFDATVSAPDETTAPTAGTAEQHDAAEFAAESEPTAAPQPVAASDLEPSDAAEPQKEAAAIKPPEQLPRPPAPANDLRASAQGGGDRSADVAADAASSSSPLRPVEPAATGSAGARDNDQCDTGERGRDPRDRAGRSNHDGRSPTYPNRCCAECGRARGRQPSGRGNAGRRGRPQ